jgi:hypothetical protein
VAGQRLPGPVQRDIAEQAVLNPVPLSHCIRSDGRQA